MPCPAATAARGPRPAAPFQRGTRATATPGPGAPLDSSHAGAARAGTGPEPGILGLHTPAEGTRPTTLACSALGYRGAVSFNGNLSDDGTLTYEYNYRNEICRVKNGGTTVATYKYDALGRRVEKAVTGGVTERYIYAGVETIATYDGSNTWKQDFVFGQGIDNVLMLEQADVLDFDSDQNTSETTRSFYHKNALGSVMAVTDMNEATAVSYRYDPYGKITITRGGQTQSSDPLGQHWTYTGRFRDEETGLYYYRARYSNPVLGRFLQRDPRGYVAGPCLFEYAGSSPAVARDPSGEIVEVCYRTLDQGGPANHAYIKITDASGHATYLGDFWGGPSGDPTANEGTKGQEQHCRRVTPTFSSEWFVWYGMYGPEPYAPKKSATGIPCTTITPTQIEDCLKKAAAQNTHKVTSDYSCGDWTGDILKACCLPCDAVPWTSRASMWCGLVGLCGGGYVGPDVGHVNPDPNCPRPPHPIPPDRGPCP